MLNERRGVSKVYIYLGVIIILVMAISSYIYTGSFVSGMQPIVEDKVVEPVSDKISDKLNEMIQETGVYDRLGEQQ